MSYFSNDEEQIGVSFLDRLTRNQAKARGALKRDSSSEIIRSIKRNLSNILNCRMGGAQSAPQIGLIDFNDAIAEASNLSLRMESAIKTCLEQYEPRLTSVVVHRQHDEDNPLALRFDISALLEHERQEEAIQLSLIFDKNSHYHIR